jgi:hypothetical protein
VALIFPATRRREAMLSKVFLIVYINIKSV